MLYNYLTDVLANCIKVRQLIIKYADEDSMREQLPPKGQVTFPSRMLWISQVKEVELDVSLKENNMTGE